MGRTVTLLAVTRVEGWQSRASSRVSPPDKDDCRGAGTRRPEGLWADNLPHLRTFCASLLTEMLTPVDQPIDKLDDLDKAEM